MAFFGLKLSQDNRAAHPTQEFPGVLPPRGPATTPTLLKQQQQQLAVLIFLKHRITF